MIELETFCPKLKPNLRFGIQSHGGESCCVIEDSAREKFWRLGVAEFRFLAKMDGATTVVEILRAIEGGPEAERLSPEDAQQVLVWLAHEGLLENLNTPPVVAKQKWLAGLNRSVFLRLPLGNPQPLLEWLYPAIGFMTGPWFALVWGSLLLFAGVTVVGRWDEFQAASLNVVATDQWYYFLLIWWSLKAVHELFHGLTCVRYGGNVRESGILFILFAPLGAYVDVTSSWRFSSKWKRLHVSAAGIYIELMIAALAVLGWAAFTDPFVRQICLQTVILATVATLLFNGNPLIRFDGYYLLSDWIEVPNLYQQGQLAIRGVFNRFFYGERGRSEFRKWRKRLFVFGYGVAAFVWRVLLNAGIILAAAMLLEGAGVLLAVALTIGWFVIPMAKSLWSIVPRFKRNPLGVLRAAVLFVLLGGSGFLVATRVEVPSSLIVPGVVKPVQSTLVRAEAAGKIEELLVRPGQSVLAGQILGRISNPELGLRLLEKRQELKRNELTGKQYHVAGNISQKQAVDEVAQTLQRQIALLEDEQARLVIRSPQDGLVLDFDLDGLQGRYVLRGEALVEIGDLNGLEFSFSVGQDLIKDMQLAREQGSSARIFVPGYPAVSPAVETMSIRPRADWNLEDEALSALNGGPVAVAQVALSESESAIQTLHPQCLGRIQLPLGSRLQPGAVGSLRVILVSKTIEDWVRPWLAKTVARVADQIRGVVGRY